MTETTETQITPEAAVACAVAEVLAKFGTAAVLEALSDAADAAGDHLEEAGTPRVGHPSVRFHSAAVQLRSALDTTLAAEKAGGVPLAAAADVLAEIAVE